jgi:hypothetical protein
MPASRSARRDIERARPARRWPLFFLGLVVFAAALVFALPASLIARFLPAQVHAEDFSGSLLHGAASKLLINGRDAGAVEWQIHPLSLLRLAVVADVHWVKVSFVLDGTAEIGPRGIAAHGIKGGGPIGNLQSLGVAAGWKGTANVMFTEIAASFRQLESAEGRIAIAEVSSAEIAAGSDLGNYVLQLAPASISPDGSINATLSDEGGPVEAQAQVRFSPATRTGMLTGTIKERPEASPALLIQLSNLAQLRRRDSFGRLPLELEFSF